MLYKQGERNMAKITKKQMDAIDAACRNGFSFDRYDFTMLGEKRLSKSVSLVEGSKAVKLSLGWRNEIVKYTNEYGCTAPTYTGNVVPQLHCSVWEKASMEGCWHSSGQGKFHVFRDKAFPKRMMSRLCEVTELVTDELICEMLPEYEREVFRRETGQATE